MKKTTLIIIISFSSLTVKVYAQSISNLDQVGSHNQGVITQTGHHTSQLTQKSNASTSSEGNSAEVKQSDIIPSNITGNNSTVEQHGNSHTTKVTQTGKNTLESYIGASGAANVGNETYTTQYGKDNTGQQAILGITATKSKLTLIQNGNDNNSDQNALSSITSTGYVAQSGNENIAWQQIEGEKNDASTTQLENNNYSYQQIEGPTSSKNTSTVTQTGDYNTSRIVTTGVDNKFGLQQIGDDNKLVGISGNIASNAVQNGNLNKTSLLQNGDENDIRLEQNGNSNTIKGYFTTSATQFGNNNQNTFSQNGEGLLIQSSQYGNSNSENVIQTGSNSTSNAIQTGNLNSSVVRQGN